MNHPPSYVVKNKVYVTFLSELFPSAAFTIQHCPKVKLMSKHLCLKLSNYARRVCVAAVLRELQMMHVSTEHQQRVWTKWPVLPYTLIFIQSGVNKFKC